MSQKIIVKKRNYSSAEVQYFRRKLQSSIQILLLIQASMFHFALKILYDERAEAGLH